VSFDRSQAATLALQKPRTHEAQQWRGAAGGWQTLGAERGKARGDGCNEDNAGWVQASTQQQAQGGARREGMRVTTMVQGAARLQQAATAKQDENHSLLCPVYYTMASATPNSLW